MFIDPPEGCKGPSVNLNNVAAYWVLESECEEDGWVVVFTAHGCRVGWEFPSKEAASEGMAYIKELRGSGEVLNINAANRFFRGSNGYGSRNW